MLPRIDGDFILFIFVIGINKHNDPKHGKAKHDQNIFQVTSISRWLLTQKTFVQLYVPSLSRWSLDTTSICVLAGHTTGSRKQIAFGKMSFPETEPGTPRGSNQKTITSF